MPENSSPQQNYLLAALSKEAQERLFVHLELVEMPLGKVLYESGDTLRHDVILFDQNTVKQANALITAPSHRDGIFLCQAQAG